MSVLIRRACPIYGCRLWHGFPVDARLVDVSMGNVERESLGRHLDTDHPDVDAALLWDVFERVPRRRTERAAMAVACLVAGLVLALTLACLVTLASRR